MQDVSAEILEQLRTYGGSDRVAASFNATRYVRHGSTTDPLDLGPLLDGDTFLEGVVGGESGSQSLYVAFSLDGPARLGARLVPGNRYRDQYIGLNVSSPAGAQVPQRDLVLVPSPPPRLDQAYVTVTITDGYAETGYWLDGYALFDGGTVQTISSPEQSPSPPPLLPGGDVLPGGAYRAVISTSRWSELPFVLHLATRRPRSLSGSADLVLEMDGRTSLQRAGALADLFLEVDGRIANVAHLAGTGDLSLAPVAALSRVSPFQP